jgi:hypothetical protein
VNESATDDKDWDFCKFLYHKIKEVPDGDEKEDMQLTIQQVIAEARRKCRNRSDTITSQTYDSQTMAGSLSHKSRENLTNDRSGEVATSTHSLQGNFPNNMSTISQPPQFLQQPVEGYQSLPSTRGMSSHGQLSQVNYSYGGFMNALSECQWTEADPRRQQMLQQDYGSGNFCNLSTHGGNFSQSQLSQVIYLTAANAAAVAGCLQNPVNSATTAASNNANASHPEESSQLLEKTYAELQATSWQENEQLRFHERADTE